jgi:hypothetical protein
MFYSFEPVLYLDPVSKFRFPETTERPGYFIGFADNVGDALTFKILKKCGEISSRCQSSE